MFKKFRLILSPLLICMMVFVFPTQTYALNMNVDTDILTDNVAFIADWVNLYGYTNTNGDKVIAYNPDAQVTALLMNEGTQLHFSYYDDSDEHAAFVDMYVKFPYSEWCYTTADVYLKNENGNVTNATIASVTLDPSDYKHDGSVHFVIQDTSESSATAQEWANTALYYAINVWDDLLVNKMDMSIVQLGFSQICNHSWKSVITKKATCNSSGERKKTCEWCGQIKYETVAKLPVKVGSTITVSAGTVKVLSTSSKTVAFTKAKNKRSITVPATVKIGGKTYKVTQINANAFKGSKIKTVTIGKNVKVIKKNAFKGSKATKLILKTKLLKKSKVKGCLKGSKVKTIQVKVGSKKSVNATYVKNYKKIFTKANSGRKVTVK